MEIIKTTGAEYSLKAVDNYGNTIESHPLTIKNKIIMNIIKKEIWYIGKSIGSIVTNNPNGFNPKTGHDDTDYYGGFLVCESVGRKKDVSLICAAPDLLEACIAAKAIFDSQGIDQKHRICGEQYKLIINAIDKANGKAI